MFGDYAKGFLAREARPLVVLSESGMVMADAEG